MWGVGRVYRDGEVGVEAAVAGGDAGVLHHAGDREDALGVASRQYGS